MPKTNTTIPPAEELERWYQTFCVEDGGSKADLARHLDIPAATLYYHLKKHGIGQPAPQEQTASFQPETVPPPPKSIPAPETAPATNGAKPATISTPAETVTTEVGDQLDIIRRLMASLQADGVRLSGRVTIDLHAEIDFGNGRGGGYE